MRLRGCSSRMVSPISSRNEPLWWWGMLSKYSGIYRGGGRRALIAFNLSDMSPVFTSITGHIDLASQYLRDDPPESYLRRGLADREAIVVTMDPSFCSCQPGFGLVVFKNLSRCSDNLQ